MNNATRYLINAINRNVNNIIKYKDEGALNNWQSPELTLELGTGDCEDYAMLKMRLLEPLIDKSLLRVIYLYTIYNKPHMVLSIKTESDYIILDNLNRLTMLLSDTVYNRIVYFIDANGVVYTKNGQKTKGKAELFNKAMGIT